LCVEGLHFFQPLYFVSFSPLTPQFPLFRPSPVRIQFAPTELGVGLGSLFSPPFFLSLMDRSNLGLPGLFQSRGGQFLTPNLVLFFLRLIPPSAVRFLSQRFPPGLFFFLLQRLFISVLGHCFPNGVLFFGLISFFRRTLRQWTPFSPLPLHLCTLSSLVRSLADRPTPPSRSFHLCFPRSSRVRNLGTVSFFRLHFPTSLLCPFSPTV